MTIIMLSNISFADSIEKNIDSSMTISSYIEPTSENDKKTELFYYKNMYENAKETNDKLLNLLVTALTILIGVIIAIIGSSIFYNYRFNKKEYELLTKETTNKLNQAQDELKQKTKVEIDKLIEKTNSQIDKKFDQISDTYKSNYETIRESLKTIVLSFKEDIESKQNDFSKKIEKLENQSENSLEDIKSTIDHNDKRLELDIYDLRGMLYMHKKWYSNALYVYVDKSLLCIELNSTYQLEFNLPNLIEAIEKTIETKGTITSNTKSKIEKLLKEIPDYFSQEKEIISKLYPEIIIKELEPSKRNVTSDLLNLYGVNPFERKKLKRL